MFINLIAACDSNGFIGTHNNKMPWPWMKEDMEYFRNTTKGGIVLMGRKTFESLGCRPLPGRLNLILTSTDRIYDGAFKVSSIHEAVTLVPNRGIWVIGGGMLYEQCLQEPYVKMVKEVHLTRINKGYDNVSVQFPLGCLDGKFKMKSQRTIYNEDNNVECQFYVLGNACGTF
jgi:dihydrofolate reductase